MPLVRISHPAGLDPERLGRAVHEALVATIGIPADDFFQVHSESGAGARIFHPPSYLGIDYSDGFTVLQITISQGRTVEQKKALYAAIVTNLQTACGVRPEDVMINLLEVAKENWSFGRGEAQYA